MNLNCTVFIFSFFLLLPLLLLLLPSSSTFTDDNLWTFFLCLTLVPLVHLLFFFSKPFSRIRSSGCSRPDAARCLETWLETFFVFLFLLRIWILRRPSGTSTTKSDVPRRPPTYSRSILWRYSLSLSDISISRQVLQDLQNSIVFFFFFWNFHHENVGVSNEVFDETITWQSFWMCFFLPRFFEFLHSPRDTLIFLSFCHIF